MVRLSALIGRRSVAWFGWRDVWGPRGKIGDLSESNGEREVLF